MPVEGWGGSDVVNDFPGWSGLIKPSNLQVILNYDWCIFSHNSAADFSMSPLHGLTLLTNMKKSNCLNLE